MSPLSGSKDTKQDDRYGDAEVMAGVQQLAALPQPQLAAEGMQLLEHACLVRCTVRSSQGGIFFTDTRLGRGALAQGTVGSILASGAR